MKASERLWEVCHAVVYDPSRRMSYMVRFPGYDKKHIDFRSFQETEDILGFGETLEKAAEDAFRELECPTRFISRALERERAS